MSDLREQRISGLGHEDFFVRGFFLGYFEDALESDPTVSKAVIAALDKYGLQKAFEFPHRIRSLGHDEETVQWLVELSGNNPFSRDDSFALHLIEWFAKAPVALLKRYHREFEDSPWHGYCWGSGRRSNASSRAEFRVEASDWSEQECLSKLDEIADTCMALDEFSADKVTEAHDVCEVLARQSDLCSGIVSEWLDFDFESDFNRRHWFGGFAIDLCGLLRLDSNAARLVEMLSYDWDWWNESVERALKRMQSVKVWNVAAESFEELEDHARLFLSGCLGSIQVDGGESRLVEILEDEDDSLVASDLAIALANYNSEIGLEKAREVYLEYPEDPEFLQIVHALYAYRRLGGEKNSELDQWEQRLTNEFISAQQTLDRMQARTVLPQIPFVGDPKIGRNDACPCGSGKKYKKCCLE